MQALNTKRAQVIMPDEGQPMNVMGHAVTLKLTSRETAGDSYIFEVVSPAGLGIPPHVHANEDEAIYVLSGVYEIFLDGQLKRAEAGSWLHFPRGVPHGFQNVGATAGRTLWVVTPGAGFEQFFAELGALPAGAPPDMGQVAAIFGRYDIQILPPAA